MEMLKIKEMYDDFKLGKHNYEKILSYYKGNTDAKKDYKTTDRSNLFISNNYLKKFVKEEVSYSVGNAISYTSKGDNVKGIESLNEVLENISENHDIEGFKNMLLYGLGFEITYINQRGDLGLRLVAPTNGYATYDEEGNILSFIHYYLIGNEERLTYYDKDIILKLDKELNVLEEVVNVFEGVPVSVARLSDLGWEDTLYSDIKGLQDALETNMSDITNEISDFRNAYMVLRGLQLDDSNVDGFKKNSILEIPTSDGGAEWLIKNINDTFIQNTIKTLKQQLYELTSHINHNDIEQTSNASGVALKSKLISLMQRCVYNQNAYNELLKNRLWLIQDYLEKKKGATTFDWKDIKITYTPCIPSDDLQTAQMIQMLDGKVSKSTLLTLLSFVENAEEEAAKLRTEIEEGILDPYNEFEGNILNENEGE